MKDYRKIEDDHLLNSFYKLPIVISKAEGFYVYDVYGKEYLDMMCGYGVALLGHNHEIIKKAILKQIERIMICHSSLYLDVRAEFLDFLFKVLPSSLKRCFLTNSGSEAIELAIKIVRKRGKKGIISMINSYHGKTLGSLSVTGKKKYRESFEPLLSNVKFANYGDLDDLLKKIDQDTGAVILEPIQGEAGVIIPSDDYLRAVRDICYDKDILLILDEIQTGLGRTGKLFCFEHYNIEPDILCIGKGLAGGLPVGCVITKEELNVLKVGEHTSTFSANPLVCAIAKEVLSYIVDNKLYENAREMGNLLLDKLNLLKGRFCIKDVRGRGLMLAVEFEHDIRDLLFKALKNGLICGYTSPNILRFLPPLNITPKEIEIALEKLENSLSSWIPSKH